MVLDRDWELPPVAKTGLQLDRGELLLLLWTIGAASNLLEREALHEPIWQGLRARAWKGLTELGTDINAVADFPLTPAIAELLQSYCPCTFRWGTGPDCGYTLSDKIAHHLRGDTYPIPKPPPKSKLIRPNQQPINDD